MVKRYKALLNKGASVQNSGFLIEGREYFVRTYFSGDDITNVGGENASNTRFTATGTTPAIWSNFTEIMNVLACAPVAIELENTIGSVTYEYDNHGQYYLVCTGAFPIEKTICKPHGLIYLCTGLLDGNANDKESYKVLPSSSDKILIQTFRDENPHDEILYYTPIEIEVHC